MIEIAEKSAREPVGRRLLPSNVEDATPPARAELTAAARDRLRTRTCMFGLRTAECSLLRLRASLAETKARHEKLNASARAKELGAAATSLLHRKEGTE